MECPSSACSSGLEHSCHNDTEHVILRIKEGMEKVSPASHNVLTQNPCDLKQAAWAWFLSRAVFSVLYLWALNFQASKERKESQAQFLTAPGLPVGSLLIWTPSSTVCVTSIKKERNRARGGGTCLYPQSTGEEGRGRKVKNIRPSLAIQLI